MYSLELAALAARYESLSSVGPKLLRRNVLVTGASRGIGLAIAYIFGVHQAMNVFLVGRDQGRLDAAADIISKRVRKEQSVHVRVGDVKDRNFWVELSKEMVS